VFAPVAAWSAASAAIVHLNSPPINPAGRRVSLGFPVCFSSGLMQLLSAWICFRRDAPAHPVNHWIIRASPRASPLSTISTCFTTETRCVREPSLPPISSQPCVETIEKHRGLSALPQIVLNPPPQDRIDSFQSTGLGVGLHTVGKLPTLQTTAAVPCAWAQIRRQFLLGSRRHGTQSPDGKTISPRYIHHPAFWSSLISTPICAIPRVDPVLPPH